MHVALLCLDPHIPLDGEDGRPIQLRNLGAALARAGHRVQAYTRATTAVPLRRADDGLERVAIAADSPARDLQSAFGRNRPDLIIEPTWSPSADGAVAAGRLGIAHVFLVDATATCPPPEPVDWREALAASSGAVAFSGEGAQWVRAHAPRDYPVRIAACGVDPALLEPPAEGARARAHGDLGPSPGFRVGFAGALGDAHDLETLVRALGRVRPFGPIQLALIGDGPARNRLIALAHEQRLAVALTGTVPHRDVAAYLAACDAIAVPCGRPEGCSSPLKLIEAMASGRPLIATATQLAARYVRDGQDGLLVPVGDEAALATAFARLVRSVPLRERIGESARRALRARRTWDHVAGEIIEFGLACAERAS
jgi:glycosyltransferase involved in cell wall biosynthesis